MVFVENINKKTDSFNIVDSEFNEDTQQSQYIITSSHKKEAFNTNDDYFVSNSPVKSLAKS